MTDEEIKTYVAAQLQAFKDGMIDISSLPEALPDEGTTLPFVFGATVTYSLDDDTVTYDPALDYGDTTAVSAWYNKPGSGWTKVSETPVPFTKAPPEPVG